MTGPVSLASMAASLRAVCSFSVSNLSYSSLETGGSSCWSPVAALVPGGSCWIVGGMAPGAVPGNVPGVEPGGVDPGVMPAPEPVFACVLDPCPGWELSVSTTGSIGAIF